MAQHGLGEGIKVPSNTLDIAVLVPWTRQHRERRSLGQGGQAREAPITEQQEIEAGPPKARIRCHRKKFGFSAAQAVPKAVCVACR
jgi:hypothetical protein